MAAEQPTTWKAQVRACLLEADPISRERYQRVSDLRPLIEHPITTTVAAIAAARTNAGNAVEALQVVASDLAFAASRIQAAGLVGQHGSSPDPRWPVRCVAHMDAQGPDADMRSALIWIQDAMASGEATCTQLQWCRARLAALCILLDHPGLPDFDAVAEGQRAAALAALDNALGSLHVCVMACGSALHVLPPT